VTETVANSLYERGFAFLPKHAAEIDASVAIRQIGSVIKLAGFDTLQTLSPKLQNEATPNTYSGNFGLDDFPFHSDLAHWARPPRYLALRCINGGIATYTQLIDSSNIVDLIGEVELRRTLVMPRRPQSGRKQLLRLLERFDGAFWAFRWDPLFLSATEECAEVLKQVALCIAGLNPHRCLLSESGDTLVVDNWRMLHGRSRVADSDVNRVIVRAYLEDIR